MSKSVVFLVLCLDLYLAVCLDADLSFILFSCLVVDVDLGEDMGCCYWSEWFVGADVVEEVVVKRHLHYDFCFGYIHGYVWDVYESIG